MQEKKCLTYSQINKMFNTSDISFSSSFSFREIDPFSMYQDIFSTRELEEQGKQEKGKYNLIVRRIKYNDNNERVDIRSRLIFNGLKELEKIINSNGKYFNILSCISYAGKDNTMDNARFMYALVLDLDNLQANKTNGLELLFDYYIIQNRLPLPNYVVSSGHGIHLYFLFDKPIPLYKNVRDKLFELKKQMVKRVWNEDISTIEEQHGSITQGFRVGGTFTKDFKHKAKCFKTNATKKYTLYDLAQTTLMKDNEKEEYKNIDKIKSNLTLEECKKKFPLWYQRRIIEKQPKGKWNIKKDLYYWWLNQIKEKNKYHHRYFCCMCAVIYAVKCNISKEQVKKDLIDLLPFFNQNCKEPFTEQDINDSLKIYNENNYFWTKDKMSLLSNIEMPTNKRNGLSQKEHIKIMSFIRDIKYKNNDFRKLKGQKKKEEIMKYLYTNKKINTQDIMKECKVSKPTAIKYKKMYLANRE